MEFNAKYCLRKANEGYEKQIKEERKVIIKRIKEKMARGEFHLYYTITYTENEDWLIDRGFKLTPHVKWGWTTDNTLIDWSNEE